jgi:hypothetical protein
MFLCRPLQQVDDYSLWRKRIYSIRKNSFFFRRPKQIPIIPQPWWPKGGEE